MADNRVEKRLKKRLSIKFGAPEPSRIAFTEDLHENGMFIKTTNVAPPGSRLLVEVTLPSDEKVLCESMVMWAKRVPPQVIHLVKKSGMGVKITKIISGEEAFSRYCESLAEIR